MERVTVDAVDPVPSVSGAEAVRVLGPALGAEHVAINHFELAPGQHLAYAYHRHLDQEELFSVLAGTVTFETESGEVTVEAGEIVRFEPGEFQLGHNRGDERARVLAVGAPPDSEAIEYRQDCPDCGEETVQTPDVVEDGTVLIHCTDCGARTDEIRR